MLVSSESFCLSNHCIETSLCIILLYFVTFFALNFGEMAYRNVYFSHFEHYYLGVNI